MSKNSHKPAQSSSETKTFLGVARPVAEKVLPLVVLAACADEASVPELVQEFEVAVEEIGDPDCIAEFEEAGITIRTADEALGGELPDFDPDVCRSIPADLEQRITSLADQYIHARLDRTRNTAQGAAGGLAVVGAIGLGAALIAQRREDT